MTQAGPETRKITLRSGLVADVLTKGQGAPLLFLHPAHGRTWSPFLDGLAEQFTVYAPLTPGADEPEELMSFDSVADLALFYDDLLRALNIDAAIVIGHAFGGMAAAEFAAHFPERVASLVLIDALGLWIDETPIADIYTTHPTKLPGLLFTDPEGPEAKSVLHEAVPEDRLIHQLVLGAATHFIWPIPDRDLKRRLYRISAPTLLIWGASDRVVPPVYADAFAKLIPQAKKLLVEGASHFPHLEKPEQVARAIAGFVAETVGELTPA